MARRRLGERRVISQLDFRDAFAESEWSGDYDITPRDRLTDKEAAFVNEYTVDFNATQAAIRAGYSKRTARVIGQENLLKPAVRTVIKARLQQVALDARVHAEHVLREQVAVAFGTLEDIVEWAEDGRVTFRPSSELTPAQWSSIKKFYHHVSKEGAVTMKVELHDKISALRDLGKHLGFYDDEQPVPEQSWDQRLDEILKRLLARMSERKVKPVFAIPARQMSPLDPE